MSKSRNIADLGSNDVIETSASGIDVTGTVVAGGLSVDAAGDVAFGSTFFWDASAEALGIGTTTTTAKLNVAGDSADGSQARVTGGTNENYQLRLGFDTTNLVGKIQSIHVGTAYRDLSLQPDGGNVGIGTSSPTTKLDLELDSSSVWTTSTSPSNGLEIYNTNTTAGSYSSIRLVTTGTGSTGGAGLTCVDTGNGSGDLVFSTRGVGVWGERARIDSSGNLLVGKTAADGGVNGGEIRSSGETYLTATSAQPLALNRKSTDGNLATFSKDGTTVGSIANYNGGNSLAIYGKAGTTHYLGLGTTLRYAWDDNQFYPVTDGAKGLGVASYRWSTVYAVTGTINTSDRNLKQDIRDITEAEQRVAMACKGLMKAYRFKDAVAVKGDNARMHFGIIAQDLQAAFEAEGLDASRYGVFCSDTRTDEETGEVHTRLGVRYEELLAFIIAAL